MKTPLAVFKKIQQARADLNERSYKNLKESIAASGSEHFDDKYGSSAGSQAGDVISGFTGSIKFGTERVSSDEG